MQGSTINGYEFVSLIGRGGMAEVWKAQNSLGISVAIKVLNANLSQEANIVERFKGEARIMAALKHKNIREVRDLANLTDGRPCIIMEYLEGADLSSRMKRGESFTNAQLEKWWNQLVSALNYTHEHGYIHRDIKPSNIFITNDGDVKLMDFGIAKNGIGDGTGTGSKMGTLMYMSPEQVNDVKRVSPKTDVYSLAVTFVHLVSGKTPYDSSSTEYSIMTSILNTPLDTSGLPAPWNEFLKPYLVKDSVQRADFMEMPLGMQGTCTQTPKPISMPMSDEGTIVDNGRTKIEDESPFEFKVAADLKKLSDFPAKGGQTPVYVKTNGEENLLFPPSSWISSSRSASVNGGKHLYILTIQKNKSSQSRAMTIKVVSKKDSLAREDFINIKQKGKKSRWWIWVLTIFFLWCISCVWLMPLDLAVSPQNLDFNCFGGYKHLHPEAKYLIKIRNYGEQNMSVSADANWLKVKIVYPNFYIRVDCDENDEYNDRNCKITVNTKYGFVKDVVVVKQRGKVSKIFSKSGSLNNHEYVDLGLPSGTKWAACNIGSDSKYSRGDYYAWGAIKTEKVWIRYPSIKNGTMDSGVPNKNAFTWESYKYSREQYALTKYCTDSEWGYNGFVDNIRTLQPSDDVATSLWGKGWRMPTKSDYEELLTECKWKWESYNTGYTLTGPNGNSIFMPCASCWDAGNSMYDDCLYWTSTIYDECPLRAYCISIARENESFNMIRNRGRNCGLLVRPVCK